MDPFVTLPLGALAASVAGCYAVWKWDAWKNRCAPKTPQGEVVPVPSTPAADEQLALTVHIDDMRTVTLVTDSHLDQADFDALLAALHRSFEPEVAARAYAQIANDYFAYHLAVRGLDDELASIGEN